VRALPPVEDQPYSFAGRRQQTEPARCVPLDMARHVWDLAEHMDGTAEPNANFLAAAPVGESAVILRRRSGSGTWAHVRIRDVKIDLDKTPVLSLKLRDLGRGTADSTAVKVLDHETQRMVVLGEFYSGFYQYRAFDLREHLEVTGQRTLDLKFYCLGDAAGESKTTQTGVYILLQFLRAKAK